jgi:hypothetical protein
MTLSPPHIVVKIRTSQPIDVDDFAAIYTALGSQYRKFVQAEFPEVGDDATIYVRDVTEGSIIVELVPWVLATWHSVPDALKRVDIVVEFVKKYGELLGIYLTGQGRPKEVGRSDLNDFTKQVAAIANDPRGSARIEAAVFEDGKRKIRAAIKFRTPEARRAIDKIEAHRLQLEKKSGADHTRVFMIFHQANVRASPLGKRTGERVRIDEISRKVLPLIYASELAEERIKSEIREAEDNLFRKGFVVDVNVAAIDGRPVAYRVTNVHQVIDLPDDDEQAEPVLA